VESTTGAQDPEREIREINKQIRSAESDRKAYADETAKNIKKSRFFYSQPIE